MYGTIVNRQTEGEQICKSGVSDVMKRYIGFLRDHHGYSWQKFLDAEGLQEYLDRDELERRLKMETTHKVKSQSGKWVRVRRVSVNEAIDHLYGLD